MTLFPTLLPPVLPLPPPQEESVIPSENKQKKTSPESKRPRRLRHPPPEGNSTRPDQPESAKHTTSLTLDGVKPAGRMRLAEAAAVFTVTVTGAGVEPWNSTELEESEHV